MTEVLHREFPTELHTEGDGRTVDARIVPYGVPTEVSDGGPVYREEWAEGAFDDQLVAGHRLKVFLNFEHETGLNNVIGRGVSLRSETDGLYGSFRMRPNENGDHALELIREGVLDGISLEAYAKPPHEKTAAGIVRRVKAHLHNVALCRNPAYKDAKVLAVRTEPIIDEDLLPIDMDPETVERCRRLGLELPPRYTAHPDVTGTPALTGTPESGTRQPVTAATSGGKDERHTE